MNVFFLNTIPYLSVITAGSNMQTGILINYGSHKLGDKC